MKFTWEYQEDIKIQLKTFLKNQGISKKLLAKIKFQGGKIEVNKEIQNVLAYLSNGDKVDIEIPDEGEYESLLRDPKKIEIVYEDEHYLIVNKPSDVASIPAQYHPNGTMANRVKHYYCTKEYKNRIVHVVTRLDRDTTGLMLFAKHGFAHSLLDRELRNKKVKKIYQALVGNAAQQLEDHGIIDGSICRDETSLLKRKVDSSGQQALTEYWTKAADEKIGWVSIQLHTGRTHQIRVHFSSIGSPLLGDEMYGGNMEAGITRQALHCSDLSFFHPFLKKEMEFKLPLPLDMEKVLIDCQLIARTKKTGG